MQPFPSEATFPFKGLAFVQRNWKFIQAVVNPNAALNVEKILPDVLPYKVSNSDYTFKAGTDSLTLFASRLGRHTAHIASYLTMAAGIPVAIKLSPNDATKQQRATPSGVSLRSHSNVKNTLSAARDNCSAQPSTTASTTSTSPTYVTVPKEVATDADERRIYKSILITHADLAPQREPAPYCVLTVEVSALEGRVERSSH